MTLTTSNQILIYFLSFLFEYLFYSNYFFNWWKLWRSISRLIVQERKEREGSKRIKTSPSYFSTHTGRICMRETTSSAGRRHVKHRHGGAGRHKSDFSSSPPSFRLQYPQEFLNSGAFAYIRKQQDCSSWLHITTYVQDTLARQWLQPTSWRLFTGQRGKGERRERKTKSEVQPLKYGTFSFFFSLSQISSAIFLSQSFLFTWDFSFFFLSFFPPLFSSRKTPKAIKETTKRFVGVELVT